MLSSIYVLFGILVAGFLRAFLSPETVAEHLGGGIVSMIIMLAAGIPMYICATASTPIAAALILKGVSPGAALVFLLAGPATNIASLTMTVRILGRRSTIIYLSVIALFSIVLGIILDQIYLFFDISAQASAGSAGEIIPSWAQTAGAFVLLALSIKPLYNSLRSKIILMGIS